MLNSMLKLIDHKKKEIKFEDKEKKMSNSELCASIFGMSKSFKKTQKTREQHIKYSLTLKKT